MARKYSKRCKTPMESFHAKHFVDQGSGCWLWTGATTEAGYGVFWARPLRYAHVFAYEMFIGPIPEGLELDHKCRVRNCCNPRHLEPVTHAENTRRGIAGVLYEHPTHCPKGHPYSGENLSLRFDGRRRCKECKREEYHRLTPEARSARVARKRELRAIRSPNHASQCGSVTES